MRKNKNFQEMFKTCSIGGIKPLFFYLESIFDGVNDEKKCEKMRMDCTPLKNSIKS